MLASASIAWALRPDDAWLDSNLQLAYLAAFAGAVALARLAPRRSGAVVAGVLGASLVLCAWALAAKVVPEHLAEDALFARLREPFGYWNSVGLAAAMGVPACLWAGTLPGAGRALRAAVVPALGLLAVAALLAFSRGALIAIGLGAGVWIALVPRRLAAIRLLALAAAGAAPVVAYAIGDDTLGEDRVALAARTDAGHELGLVLLAMIAGLYLLGWASDALAARRPLTERGRRRVGTALIVVLALTPIAAAGAMTASERGLGGTISDRWHDLTDPGGVTRNDASRLTAASNSRSRYWREAWHAFRDHPVLGAGAGNFSTARLRYRRDELVVRHAHGWLPQVLAELGLVGAALGLALLAAWLAAATRALGLRRRTATQRRGTSGGSRSRHSRRPCSRSGPLGDRLDLVGAGNALVALLCAGWIAAQPRPGAVTADAGASALRPRILAAVAAVAVVVTCAWTAWQPLRAQHSSDAALAAIATGDEARARTEIDRARDRNPLTIEPLFDLAVLEDRLGRKENAAAALQQAVGEQPANPSAWLRLGEYALASGLLEDAAAAFGAALYLDPRSREAQQAYLETLRQGGAG